MKRFFVGLLVAIMLATATPAFASTLSATTAQFTVKVNGVAAQLSASPVLISGSTYLPLRATADLLGYDVGYDGANRIISLTDKVTTGAGAAAASPPGNPGTQLTAITAQFTIKVNGEVKQLSSSPVLINGSTYLPLRATADLLGYDVGYDGASRTISLTDKLIAAADGTTWSVFVYLCGTDLESQKGFLASVNIEEMVNADQSDAVSVVFQTGGTAQWGYDIDPAKLQRFEVVDDGFVLRDEQALASMGEADTLGDFLAWGVENYPADKYMCLLWNHGGGSVSGVAFDELYEHDSLNLDELAAGLSMAGTQFEVIGFDTCLMSTLETAAAIAPYGRYMVASEEIEPGTGWDYTAWLSRLSNNSAQTGLELGRTICDTYYQKCQLAGTEDMVTLAVTDLAKVPALVVNFDAMAAEMKGVAEDPEQMQLFSQAVLRAENYGGNNDNEGYTNMIDLGDLARLTKGVLPQTTQAVLTSLNNAVKYRISGSSRARSNGLSVFAPLSVGVEELDSYAAVAVSGHYLRYLEGTLEWQVPGDLRIVVPVAQSSGVGTKSISITDFPVVNALTAADYSVEFETYVLDNDYYLVFTDGADAVQSVQYNLYFLDEEANSLNYLGSDYDLNADAEAGVYWSNFRNVWPIINDNTCSMTPLYFGDDYILYTVPILLNGEQTNLRMSYSYASNSYTVHGTWDGIDEFGMSSKEIRQLADGDKIEFLFTSIGLETGEVETFAFGGFTVHGDPVVEEATLFDCTYYYQFEVTDIFGNSYQSEFIAISVADGNLTIVEE